MKRQRVMILLEGHEEIAPEGIMKLKKENIELLQPDSPDDILDTPKFRECEAILVRGVKIDRNIIFNMPNLKIIARSGVGTDNIDIEAAEEKGVFVSNVPDANFISVSEHVIGMMLSLSHQLMRADKALRKGCFEARHLYMGSELKGKTIGIIGMGRIGQLVAQKCIEGFDMSVLAYDPYANKLEVDSNIQFLDDVEDLLERSDFITLHLPYIPKLHHFIDEKSFDKMKNSAYFINCARGGLVDEVALSEAIKNGKIAGAGIDVFEEEPPLKNNELWRFENVIVTPHMAASTRESLMLMAIGAVNEIINVLKGKNPKNCINNLGKTS